MKAIELIGRVDEEHRLQALVPEGVPPGPVQLIILLSENDQASVVWAQGITRGRARLPRSFNTH